MKKKLLRAGLFTLALSLAVPVMASAQEINSVYVTPKLFYSHQMGDMAPSQWSQGIWSAGVLGGKETDNNFGLGLSVGMDMGYYYDLPMRLELEYVYRGKAEFGQGPSTVWSGGQAFTASHSFDVTAHSLMANAFYDFNNDSVFTPYIGAGLGFAYLDTTYRAGIANGLSGSVASTSNNWNFAWNVGAGVAYHINDAVALDLGYRYVDLGTVETGTTTVSNFLGSSSVDYTAHEMSIGLRFSGF